MRIHVNDTEVQITEKVNMPELVKANFEVAYMDGTADEPFYVCDLGDVIRKHKLWCEKLPGIEPFYAMKCNPTPLIVQMLAKMGLGFDCASKNEIHQALESGVPAHHIIFANPAKQASHLAYSKENGVSLMTFDCVEELLKIKKYYPDAQLILRIFVGVDKAVCPLGKKFGAQFNEIPTILAYANSLSMDIVGVSFHVGSGCFDASAYEVAISISHEVFTIAKRMGIKMHTLDIGGGFPGNLDTYDDILFFETVAHTINTCLAKYFPSDMGVRVIAEPGRYYVSSAFDLACTVSSIRSFESDSAHESSISYFLNDGVYGSFNCTIFDHYIGKHYFVDDSFESEPCETYPSIFWGPTCDSMDKILDGFRIPKLSVGQCVAFRSMGAYTIAAGSCFNGFPKPYIKYYSGKEEWKVISDLLGCSYEENKCVNISLSEDEQVPTEESLLYLFEMGNVA